MERISVPTFTAQIYIGTRVDYSDTVFSLEMVRQVCQEFVNEVKLCVTVTPTEFIYVDGSEPGAIIGLINYPRFPSTKEDLQAQALTLAERLKDRLQQNRVSVVFAGETMMLGGAK